VMVWRNRDEGMLEERKERDERVPEERGREMREGREERGETRKRNEKYKFVRRNVARYMATFTGIVLALGSRIWSYGVPWILSKWSVSFFFIFFLFFYFFIFFLYIIFYLPFWYFYLLFIIFGLSIFLYIISWFFFWILISQLFYSNFEVIYVAMFEKRISEF